MILTDLNRDGGIGANCYFLEIGPFNIVLDAGIHPKQNGLRSLPDLTPLRGKRLDAIILTHCHLDHVGALPVLLREHPNTLVIMSQASHLLAPRMLHNSCNVMMRQREETGNPDYPLYTHGDVERASKHFIPVLFDHPRFLHSANGEKLIVTLHASGHVPGAAAVTLEHNGERLFISGDVLFDDLTILPGAKFPKDQADTVIIETTRGCTVREPGRSREEEMRRLLKVVTDTVANKGNILIPVFALGRMQELIAFFASCKRKGQFPAIPVYVSGLGVDLSDYFDQITRTIGGLSFLRSMLKEIGAKKIKDIGRPGRSPTGSALYLVSSGMMVARTPSYGVCASLLADAKNTICFVGYCDPDTPGGELVGRMTHPRKDAFSFDALDYRTVVKAKVEKIDLSSHAEREQLLELALSRKPRVVVLAHGDPDARAWFKANLIEANPNLRVIDPTPLKPYRIH